MTKRSYAKLNIKAPNKREYLRIWRSLNKHRLKQYRKTYFENLIKKAIFDGGYVKSQDAVHTDSKRNDEMVTAAIADAKPRPKLANLLETSISLSKR